MAIINLECSIQIERVNMHCQGIAWTCSLDMGLSSAEGQKLQSFKCAANNIFISTGKI
jgi:hypothetical protein